MGYLLIRRGMRESGCSWRPCWCTFLGALFEVDLGTVFGAFALCFASCWVYSELGAAPKPGESTGSTESRCAVCGEEFFMWQSASLGKLRPSENMENWENTKNQKTKCDFLIPYVLDFLWICLGTYFGVDVHCFWHNLCIRRLPGPPARFSTMSLLLFTFGPRIFRDGNLPEMR